MGLEVVANYRASLVSGKGRRGFSFTEILFAVMILGIGFIMVAAMFPVAIKQTQSTTEDVGAAHLAAAANDALQNLATNDNFPTGFLSTYTTPVPNSNLTSLATCVWTFHDFRLRTDPNFASLNNNGGKYPSNPFVNDRMWQAVSGNMILPVDPRYGWVAMYRRDIVLSGGVYVPAAFAQVTIIGVHVRNHATYDRFRDLTQFAGGDPEATLEPHVMFANLIQGPDVGKPAFIRFDLNKGRQRDAARLAEGMFVVISDDGRGPVQSQDSFNGYVLKLGSLRPDLGGSSVTQPTYELLPGYDLPMSNPPPLQLRNATVLVAGRGDTDPTNPNSPFDGPIQDIAVYKTFLRIQ